MLRYHPERYRHSRPYIKQLVNYFRSHVSDGMPSLEQLNEVARLIMKKYNEDVSELPFEKRPADTRLISKEINYAIHYAVFAVHGRNIFHFEPEMIEQFRQTDIDEVPVSALSFPYKSFYMSFGKQTDLDLWGEGNFVDGAYISVLPGVRLQIILSTIRHDVDYRDRTNWITNPDRYYYLPLTLDRSDVSVATVVAKALEEEIQSRDRSDLPDQSGVYEIDGRSIEVRDNKHHSSKLEAAEIREGFDVFKEALRLVINGLCYITSYMDNTEERWPDDTPKELLERLNKATNKSSRQKALAELLSRGYSKVKFCGKHTASDRITVVPTGRELTAHWRRGHWRNQACGPELKERKLIWIMPVLVRQDKGWPEQGRIYSVEEKI